MPDSLSVPDAPPDLAAIVALLEGQRALVDELEGLARRQADLVREARTEALLGLLTQRQRIIDRFLASQAELGRAAAAQVRGAADVDPARREELRSLIGYIGARLAEVMQRDAEDQRTLEGARDRIRTELASVDASRHARDAYRKSTIVKSRFADRQG
jgi:hypothetical protein